MKYKNLFDFKLFQICQPESCRIITTFILSSIPKKKPGKNFFQLGFNLENRNFDKITDRNFITLVDVEPSLMQDY